LAKYLRRRVQKTHDPVQTGRFDDEIPLGNGQDIDYYLGKAQQGL